jgi:hypothetical protein
MLPTALLPVSKESYCWGLRLMSAIDLWWQWVWLVTVIAARECRRWCVHGAGGAGKVQGSEQLRSLRHPLSNELQLVSVCQDVLGPGHWHRRTYTPVDFGYAIQMQPYTMLLAHDSYLSAMLLPLT